MLKVVLDTNVVLAAYLTKGAAFKIIGRWAEGEFDLLLSNEIVEEYLRILVSQNIDQRLISEFYAQLTRYAKWLSPKRNIMLVNEDPDDDKFFECAVEGNAEYIVSNDKHLLRVGKFEKVVVLNVQQFLKKIETQE